MLDPQPMWYDFNEDMDVSSITQDFGQVKAGTESAVDVAYLGNNLGNQTEDAKDMQNIRLTIKDLAGTEIEQHVTEKWIQAAVNTVVNPAFTPIGTDAGAIQVSSLKYDKEVANGETPTMDQYRISGAMNDGSIANEANLSLIHI